MMSAAEEKEAEGKEPLKPLFWIASSKDDLRSLPEEVQDVMGFALYQAQKGEKHIAAKASKALAEQESSKSLLTTAAALTEECTR